MASDVDVPWVVVCADDWLEVVESETSDEELVVVDTSSELVDSEDEELDGVSDVEVDSCVVVEVDGTMTEVEMLVVELPSSWRLSRMTRVGGTSTSSAGVSGVRSWASNTSTASSAMTASSSMPASEEARCIQDLKRKPVFEVTRKPTI